MTSSSLQQHPADTTSRVEAVKSSESGEAGEHPSEVKGSREAAGGSKAVRGGGCVCG